jgi:hypothetical protein
MQKIGRFVLLSYFMLNYAWIMQDISPFGLDIENTGPICNYGSPIFSQMYL